MAASSYQSSAKTSMLVMMLLMYVALEGAYSLAQGAKKVLLARDAFAAEFVRDRISVGDGQGLKWMSGEPMALNQARTEYMSGVGNVSMALTSQSGANSLGGTAARLSIDVRQATGERWSTLINIGRIEPGPLQLAPGIPVLTQLADEVQADVEASKGYGAMFRHIQAKLTTDLTDPKVSVPGIGLPFRWRNAVWVIALGVVALLVLIRYDLRRLVAADTGGSDEPWLLIDGDTGLEKLMAALWIAAVAAAPLVAGGALVYFLSVQSMLYVPETTWLQDLSVLAFVAIIQVVGFWASVTLVADVLRLRQRRAAAWEETIGVSTT